VPLTQQGLGDDGKVADAASGGVEDRGGSGRSQLDTLLAGYRPFRGVDPR